METNIYVLFDDLREEFARQHALIKPKCKLAAWTMWADKDLVRQLQDTNREHSAPYTREELLEALELTKTSMLESIGVVAEDMPTLDGTKARILIDAAMRKLIHYAAVA